SGYRRLREESIYVQPSFADFDSNQHKFRVGFAVKKAFQFSSRWLRYLKISYCFYTGSCVAPSEGDPQLRRQGSGGDREAHLKSEQYPPTTDSFMREMDINRPSFLI
ncbi:hypothetical protein AVEN_261957-2-1, partial [Araneus ventricosus]